MMKKWFEKYEVWVCMALIALYIIINSYCMQNFGIEDYRSTIINTIFSLALVILMIVLGRTQYYGLTKVHNAKKYLYFLPLLFIISMNLWNGIHINHTKEQVLFHILTMINVGFIEEVIFRGFLFKMMEKDNFKSAMIVSSITFGLGHIVNLLNGADFIPTMMQICYAMAIGYLFVVIFHKSKSLVPCMIAHSTFNALSIFNMENTMSVYVVPFFLIVVPLVYAIYLNNAIKENTRCH